jgi:hypothetical protein
MRRRQRILRRASSLNEIRREIRRGAWFEI